MNFVNNFSEGTLELYTELKEMLDTYRDKMSADDSALLDDISEEMTTSLNRVLSNGGRALAIVERMRGLGVVGRRARDNRVKRPGSGRGAIRIQQL